MAECEEVSTHQRAGGRRVAAPTCTVSWLVPQLKTGWRAPWLACTLAPLPLSRPLPCCLLTFAKHNSSEAAGSLVDGFFCISRLRFSPPSLILICPAYATATQRAHTQQPLRPRSTLQAGGDSRENKPSTGRLQGRRRGPVLHPIKEYGCVSLLY